MKEHITKEQWDELNKRQKKALDSCVRASAWTHENPFYNIGEMIEFLENEFSSLDTWADGRPAWCVFLDIRGLIEPETFIADELCDALWEAVKHKLNK